MGFGNDDPYALALIDGGTTTMDAFAPFWDYHEIIDDLKQKLIYSTMELESLQTSARQEIKRKEDEIRRKDAEIRRKEDEMRRKDSALKIMDVEMRKVVAEAKVKEEESNQLSQLLKIASRERDMLRDELQMILNNNKKSQQPHSRVPLQTESSHHMILTSCISDSDSPSETQNSYGSSPIEPIFETVTSPDILNNMNNINMDVAFNGLVPHQPQIPECKSSATNSGTAAPSGIPKFDQGSWIIDCLATTRPLPEKGKLLQAVQAVTRTTPLLKTLLVTGPLPEWRNPPPLLPHHISPHLTQNSSIGMNYAKFQGTKRQRAEESMGGHGLF